MSLSPDQRLQKSLEEAKNAGSGIKGLAIVLRAANLHKLSKKEEQNL